MLDEYRALGSPQMVGGSEVGSYTVYPGRTLKLS